MTIDRSVPVPIYHQLKTLIKEQIQNGELRPSDRLPTEQMLCERYQISRSPVRQALAELAQEGYIVRRPGVGTFVAAPSDPSIYRALLNDRRDPFLERAVIEWNSQNMERAVVLDIQISERADFHTALNISAAQGDAPDLVLLDYVWVTSYARSSHIYSLDELDVGWTMEMQEDLEAPVRRSHSIDGQLYGFPVRADVAGLWYRRDWFTAKGLSPPVTWAEWLDCMSYFARSEAKARFGHIHSLALVGGTAAGEAMVNVLLSLIWSVGGRVVDEQGRVTLDSPEVYRALDFLQSLTRVYNYVPPAATTFTWWDAAGLFATGKVPMSLGGTYELPEIRRLSGWQTEEEMIQHVGFIPVPRPEETAPPVTSLGGATWGVLSQSTQKDVSLDLMKLTATADWLVDFYGQNLQISPYRSINSRLAENHPWLREISPLLASARPRPMLKQYVNISRFLQRMFEQILWHDVSVEETVDQTASYLALL